MSKSTKSHKSYLHNNSYIKGLLYEFFSIIYLFCIGHKILKWRAKTPVGEIDIISIKRNKIYINEVKYRKILTDCYDVVTTKYESRLQKAYYWWLNNHQNYHKYFNLELQIQYLFWYKQYRLKILQKSH